MPVQLKINIDRIRIGKNTTAAKFDPDPLEASARDQIFWSNNDGQPHWPGLLLSDDGKTIDREFFMLNQIAPDGDVSSSFSPTDPHSYKYACSLHKNPQGIYDEQGVINVT